MATHSSILGWRIPWTEEPGGLQSVGLQRVRHDWSGLACMHTHMHTWYTHIHTFTHVYIWLNVHREKYRWHTLGCSHKLIENKAESESRSVVSNSLWPHGPYTPWNSPGQNWSGYPFPSPGDLPNPGIEPKSPTLQADSLPAEPQEKPRNTRVEPIPPPADLPDSVIELGSPALQQIFTNWAMREAPENKAKCFKKAPVMYSKNASIGS